MSAVGLCSLQADFISPIHTHIDRTINAAIGLLQNRRRFQRGCGLKAMSSQRHITSIVLYKDGWER